MLNRSLLRLVRGHYRAVLRIALVGLLATATYAGQALLAAAGLVTLLGGGGWPLATAALAGAAVLQLLRVPLLRLREERADDLGSAVAAALRASAQERLLAEGPLACPHRRTGEIIAVLVDGVEAVRRYVGGFLPQLLVASLSTVALTAVLAAIDPLIAAVLFGSGAIVLAAPWLSGRLLTRVMSTWTTEYRGLYAASIDIVQGMLTLKAIGAHTGRIAATRKRAIAFARASTRVVAVTSSYDVVVAAVTTGATALSVGLAALAVLDGTLAPFGLLTVLLIGREFLRPIVEVGRRFHGAYGAAAMLGRLDDLGALDALEESPAPSPPALARGPVELTLEGVTVRYPGRADAALSDIDLTLPAGSTVAVIGPSGAGKTTLINVLLGLVEPAAGTVRVNGRTVAPDHLPALAAVVSQDGYLFHGTLADNIRLARADASDAELAAVVDAAGLTEVVKQLPRGLATVVGEDGATLSGGQRQRVTLARALLRDARLLVLDEATAQLDGPTEQGVLDAVAASGAGRTTVIVAHRASALRHADQVVTLDAGRIAHSSATVGVAR